MGITLVVRSLEEMKRYGEGAAWNTLEDLPQRDIYVKECHAKMMTPDTYTAIQADMKCDVAANIGALYLMPPFRESLRCFFLASLGSEQELEACCKWANFLDRKDSLGLVSSVYEPLQFLDKNESASRDTGIGPASGVTPGLVRENAEYARGLPSGFVTESFEDTTQRHGEMWQEGGPWRPSSTREDAKRLRLDEAWAWPAEAWSQGIACERKPPFIDFLRDDRFEYAQKKRVHTCDREGCDTEVRFDRGDKALPCVRAMAQDASKSNVVCVLVCPFVCISDAIRKRTPV